MPPDWLIEFVAVALGVYLALWAQRRAERTANRRLEEDFIADLLADLDSDLAEIEAMGTRVEQYASAVRTLLTFVESDDEVPSSPKSLVEAIGFSRAMERFRPATTTVDELTASGAVRVFSRRDKLRAVLAYHRRVEAHALTYHFLWRKMADGLWPALKESVDPAVLREITDHLFYGESDEPTFPHFELRKTAMLRSALYDQLETHGLIKGELGIYKRLCVDARAVVADQG